MLHVGDEDGGLDDLGDGGTGLLEDGLEVLAGLASLLGNGALDEISLGGERDGARGEDGKGGLDGLGLYQGVSMKRRGDRCRLMIQDIRKDQWLHGFVSYLKLGVMRDQNPPAGALSVLTMICWLDIVELVLD